MNSVRGARLGPSALGLVVSTLGVGCATSELPVQHVAVYRNGVAYLERSGRVDKNEVRFTMKPTDVGDFLATLAVVDGSGTAVRSEAFPSRAGAADNPKDADRETVVLTLDGQPHDLHVGSVEQSPVWKPSYRLVMRSGGGGEPQIWGIVENFSGEDWNGRCAALSGGAWAVRHDLVKISDERYKLNQETYTLGQQTPPPSDAKAKISVNSRRIAELDAKIAALTSQFHDALLGIRVGSPWRISIPFLGRSSRPFVEPAPGERFCV
jgi:hypothetical protein